MTEEELERQFSAEFQALASRTEAFCLVISPLEAWIILSQLQLALRHSENTGESALKARAIARELQAFVAPGGALAIVARRGWDSRYDKE